MLNSCINKAGQLVMHVAAFRAEASIIDLLVTHGADPNSQTRNPRTQPETPVHAAVTMGKAENAKFLQELNVALNALKFAVRMKAKRKAAATRDAPH